MYDIKKKMYDIYIVRTRSYYIFCFSSFSLYLFLVLQVYLMLITSVYVDLWEREGTWGFILGPWNHDLSRRQMFNRRSHPGAPVLMLKASFWLPDAPLLDSLGRNVPWVYVDKSLCSLYMKVSFAVIKSLTHTSFPWIS